MVGTGRPWDEIEETMTFQRIATLQEYWRSFPPVHILVAGFVGYKAPPKPALRHAARPEGQNPLVVSENERRKGEGLPPMSIQQEAHFVRVHGDPREGENIAELARLFPDGVIR
jgi:hypothetical protein